MAVARPVLELEAKLKHIDEKAWLNGSVELKDAARMCEELVNQAKDPDSVASEMMTAVIELRKKLTEYQLGGKAKGYLDDGHDLMALKAPVERDYLSTALRTYWPGRHDAPNDGRYGIRRYEEQSVTMVAGIIGTILAAILLIEAIVGFSYVTAWGARLSMICAFTTAFALSAGMTTSAKRAEIFAATAAYAAVLVVFVSNGDLSKSQCYSAPE
ncbi:hypothetical protein LY78DRAFT_733949 [Colletotrichum sublineola]|nr:hypothetical protein LY78DRAFT_733949 [Colletotrichum sublineola]